MLEKKFKDGDLVKLKSGGPTMTVTNTAGKMIECTWFFEGKNQQSPFNPESLKIFQSKKKMVAAE